MGFKCLVVFKGGAENPRDQEIGEVDLPLIDRVFDSLDVVRQLRLQRA